MSMFVSTGLLSKSTLAGPSQPPKDAPESSTAQSFVANGLLSGTTSGATRASSETVLEDSQISARSLLGTAVESSGSFVSSSTTFTSNGLLSTSG
jgi:hypothetical protein